MLEFATSCLLALVRRTRRGGVIINEHTLTAEETRQHVEVLRRWFDFIHLDELPRRLRSPGRRPFCLMTFDDGKRSNFTQVAPELERQRVPAVFNVTTDPLSDGRCFWFDRRNQLVKALGHCPAELEVNTLKQLPFSELTERLDRACVRWGLPPQNEVADDHGRAMSWDEARSLCRRGFTIGAHGRTHAILTRESRATAFAEIEESLARVTSELGSPCRAFAYPNGNYDSELTQHAVRCGATDVMTTEPMWTDARASLTRLPRIQIFGGFTRSRIQLKIALAAFTGTLANPDGSGRTYRSNNGRSC